MIARCCPPPASWRQRGVSLLELLVATAIGVALIASLTETVSTSLRAQSVNQALDERVHDARLAIDRIEAAVRLTPPSAALPAKADATTSGTWLAGSTLRSGGVTFCLRGGALIEKSPATADCAVAADDRTLATGVSAFSFVQYQPAAMLSARVVEAAVTIGSGADAVGVAVKGRLGGASP